MKATVVLENIGDDSANQRIDNYFFKRFKNVPKSHIYQLLRSGQVRVNSKRVNFSYRLQIGDILRVPPIKTPVTKNAQQRVPPRSKQFAFQVIFEDDALLVVDKPSGLAVHGGSGISFGVIEKLRAQNPGYRFLELVHRLDRETSGVLLLAKKRSALIELHRQIRLGLTEKHYQVLVNGRWINPRQHVKLPLRKYVTSEGERRVAVVTEKSDAHKTYRDQKEMSSHTLFNLKKTWHSFSLLDAELKTGRTHQIRVHLAHLGFPIVGDDKYGDFSVNKQLAKNQGRQPLSRMFLHACSLRFQHPVTGDKMVLASPLPIDLQRFLENLTF